MDLDAMKEAMAFLGKVIVANLGYLVQEGEIKSCNPIF